MFNIVLFGGAHTGLFDPVYKRTGMGEITETNYYCALCGEYHETFRSLHGLTNCSTDLVYKDEPLCPRCGAQCTCSNNPQPVGDPPDPISYLTEKI